MPNKKGGKNYKKSKHTDDEPTMYEKAEDQMYGRVIKLLGGCNAIVYCNDNRERLCHIRGSMRRKVWIATGDIVLISIREMEASTTGNGKSISNIGRGDICAKYDPRLFQTLQQRDKSINPTLFVSIEKTEGTSKKTDTVPDDGFVFEAGSSPEDSDTDGEESTEEELKPANRTLQKQAMISYDDDNINVDDI